MANEYLVNSADLMAVADAIRSKGGTSDALTFPGGFVDAVGAIEAGGGGGDEVDYLNSVIEAKATELRGDWASLPRYGFYIHRSLQTVNLPYVKTLGDNCFAECAITSASMPLIETIPEKCFFNTYNLATVHMPSLLHIGKESFRHCNITHVPNAEKIKTIGQSAFQNAKFTEAIMPEIESLGNMCFCRTGLVKCDFGAKLSSIPNEAFYESKSLTTLILRSGTLVTLNNINAFYGCGTTINVYVPSALVGAYASATNWSAVTGATLNFVALEGSEHE